MSNRALLDRFHDDIDAADAVCSALTYASSGESLRNALENLSLDLSEQDIDSLLDLPYASKLFSGYCSTGVRALQMLRDAFKDPQIEKLYNAEKATGLYEARQALAAARNESRDGLLYVHGSEIAGSQDQRSYIPCHHQFIEIVRVNRKIVFPYVIDCQDSDENMHTRLPVPCDIDLISVHMASSFS